MDATCARQSCLLGSHSDGGSWVMRLGLFGGTFDPIHLGHLIMAEQCRESCALDRVWLVVAGAPPHKRGDRTAVTHRLEMVRIAVAGHPAFAVSEIEASRPGPHYSVETLESVHRDSPDDDLFFLIGADSLADLPTWREPARIAQLATIVVVNGSCPSRSRRSASPRPTSAAAWPKAGASAIWSPAALRPTSRPRGCIGQTRRRNDDRLLLGCKREADYFNTIVLANEIGDTARRDEALRILLGKYRKTAPKVCQM
jgi:nicotinate (nicotinamide) nucleotide adenylyltransferase